MTDTTITASAPAPDGVLALAAWYMTHKGHPDAHPYQTTRLTDIACWYLQYHLPGDGELELEIYYHPDDGWQTRVTTFSTRRDGLSHIHPPHEGRMQPPTT